MRRKSEKEAKAIGRDVCRICRTEEKGAAEAAKGRSRPEGGGDSSRSEKPGIAVAAQLRDTDGNLIELAHVEGLNSRV